MAGAVIGGGVGAVIGAASAIDKNSRGPKTQYVIKEYKTNHFFSAIYSYVLDKESKIQRLKFFVWSIETYMEDHAVLKKLTPNTGKEKEIKIKQSENDWIVKRIWEIRDRTSSYSHEKANEKVEALRYLLNETLNVMKPLLSLQ